MVGLRISSKTPKKSANLRLPISSGHTSNSRVINAIFYEFAHLIRIVAGCLEGRGFVQLVGRLLVLMFVLEQVEPVEGSLVKFGGFGLRSDLGKFVQNSVVNPVKFDEIRLKSDNFD